MHSPHLLNCTLFAGLAEEERNRSLAFFGAEVRRYARGELLHAPGTVFSSFALVLEGTVQVYCDDMEGNPMMMANVPPGETFGESLCFLERESPVYALAVTDCQLLHLRLIHLHHPQGTFEEELARRFTAMLAERTLAMNNRIQILSKLTLREKLITFFSQYGSAGRTFTVPFRREDMALYLGTNRSALSRELSKMRRDGLIDFSRNTFRIL